jgi:hypothetical protein
MEGIEISACQNPQVFLRVYQRNGLKNNERDNVDITNLSTLINPL